MGGVKLSWSNSVVFSLGKLVSYAHASIFVLVFLEHVQNGVMNSGEEHGRHDLIVKEEAVV